MLHGAKLPEHIREKKGFWARMYYTIEDYSEQSSIQGIKYIFQSGQSLVARLFWVNVVIGMLILSGYMSFQVEKITSPFFGIDLPNTFFLHFILFRLL